MTLFTVLLAGWALLQKMYAAECTSDVVLGVSFDLRSLIQGDAATRAVGCFASLLPFRCTFEDMLDVSSLLKSINRQRVDAIRHANVSTQELIDAIKPRRTSATSNPIFNTVFSYVKLPENDHSMRELAYSESAFDLWLGLAEIDGAVLGHMMFDKSVIATGHAQIMVQDLIQIYELLGTQPQIDLEFATSAIRGDGFGQSSSDCDLSLAPLSPDRIIHPWNMLCAAASDSSRVPAFIDGDTCITYTEMKIMSQSIASFFEVNNVGAGDRVAVMQRNSTSVFALHFAAAAIGATIVNLNTALVEDELAYILNDCGPCCVFADSEVSNVVRYI